MYAKTLQLLLKEFLSGASINNSLSQLLNQLQKTKTTSQQLLNHYNEIMT